MASAKLLPLLGLRDVQGSHFTQEALPVQNRTEYQFL